MFDTLTPTQTPLTDPATMDLDQLEDEIRCWAANMAAAEARWLALVAEFDHRKGWAHWGIKSCAHWLSWKCGISPGAARERVRVAHALQDLPQTSEAFAAGRISYSKVRAITRVADADIEDMILDLAIDMTASQLERFTGTMTRLLDRDNADATRKRHGDRWLKITERDGAIEGSFRLPAEMGSALPQVLQQFMPPPVSAEEVEAGVERATYRQRSADALVAMSEAAAESQTRAAREKCMVVLEVSVDAIRHDGDGPCQLREGGIIAAETARRFACDSTIVMIAHDADNRVVAESKPTASIPRSTRRALARRDRGCCRFPGCDTTIGCEAHHVVHRAHGGSHDLSNLVTLCKRHHHLVHEGGFGIEVHHHGRSATFTRPDGRPVEIGPQPEGDALTLSDANRAAGLDIDARTLQGGIGERYDHVLTTQIAFHNIGLRREHANQARSVGVSAETSVDGATNSAATGPPPPV